MAEGRLCRVRVERIVEPHPEETGCACVCQGCPYSPGDEWVLDQNGERGFWHLAGGTFCSEAWDAVSKYADSFLQGARVAPEGEPNALLVSCPNGFSPVAFSVSLVEE